ncbi:MAG: hypothetical protein NXI20_05030 [bacterium]|nr:hypothetical protein [bacterium]
MIRKDILDALKNFLVYVVLQILFINKLVLFDKAFCFFYIGFLLFLPHNVSRVYQLILGFSIGLIVDMFFDTIGIHAASSVFIMFLRPLWINITSGGSLDDGETISTRNLGFTTFVTYLTPMVFIHHLTVFVIEGYGFSGFWMILGKVFFSTLFTVAVLSIIQLIMLPTKKRI